MSGLLADITTLPGPRAVRVLSGMLMRDDNWIAVASLLEELADRWDAEQERHEAEVRAVYGAFCPRCAKGEYGVYLKQYDDPWRHDTLLGYEVCGASAIREIVRLHRNGI